MVTESRVKNCDTWLLILELTMTTRDYKLSNE